MSTQYLPVSEDEVVQYNMITNTQYNSLSKAGKKSMVNNLVQFSDGKVYKINKGGGLSNLPSNVILGNQQELEKIYREQKIKEREKLKNQNNTHEQVQMAIQHGESISV